VLPRKKKKRIVNSGLGPGRLERGEKRNGRVCWKKKGATGLKEFSYCRSQGGRPSDNAASKEREELKKKQMLEAPWKDIR